MNASLLDLNPPRIAPIKLPFAVRLSWLANQLCGEVNFRLLFREVAPGKYREARPKTQLQAYVRLLDWLSDQMPINVYGAKEYAAQLLAEGESLECGGIPVIPQGFEHEDQGSVTLAVLIVVMSAEGYYRAEAIRSYAALLASLFGESSYLQVDHLMKLPRGRVWRAEWRGLPDLLQWINHSTGFDLLDMTCDDMDFDSYPGWNAGEIKNLIALWKEAEPMFNRFTAFREWVDANPAERVPLMCRVIANAPGAMNEVTELKR